MKKITEQLIRHEGLRLTPYRCPAGRLTIGVGRNLVFTDMIRAVKEADYGNLLPRRGRGHRKETNMSQEPT